VEEVRVAGTLDLDLEAGSRDRVEEDVAGTLDLDLEVVIFAVTMRWTMHGAKRTCRDLIRDH
jgi:hypothetical protein